MILLYNDTTSNAALQHAIKLQAFLEKNTLYARVEKEIQTVFPQETLETVLMAPPLKLEIMAVCNLPKKHLLFLKEFGTLGCRTKNIR